MAAATTEAAHSPTSYGVSNAKMGMWVFLGSECLFFGALIATYLLYLPRTMGTPPPAEIFDIPFTSASSFILLLSSLGMVLALDAITHDDVRNFQIWILATALMGATFLAGQIYEFTVFAAEGMKLESSPFASSFFVLTGFHGIHVTIGVLMLVSLWAASLGGNIGRGQSEAVELIGLYWHFVDIVWIVIFTAVYLIPVG